MRAALTIAFVLEVVVFRSAVGAGANSRALAVRSNLRRRLAREFVLVASRVIFVGATAALFFAWAAALNAGGGPSSKVDCTSFGRGGVHCPSVSSTEGRPIGDIDPRQDCVSVGRGGLICDRLPTK